MAWNYFKEQVDSTGSENSRGNHGIGCIYKRLGSNLGISNGRYSSSIQRMEQRVEEMDEQHEGDGGHFLRSILQQKNLKRTTGQSD
ncbi:MAG: hypothetical protein EZS28_031346, partial [Streblomastix strix]